MRAIVLFCLFFCLCACGKPRPLTFEEQQAYMASQQCSQEATDMNPEGPFGGNPFWNSYYVMCMHNFGIPNAVINRMWF